MAWSLLIAQTVPVGEYVSVWKVLPVLILFLIWARLLTWIDKDAPEVLLPRDMINTGMILGLVAGFALFLILPGFLVAFAVLLLIMVIEIGALKSGARVATTFKSNCPSRTSGAVGCTISILNGTRRKNASSTRSFGI